MRPLLCALHAHTPWSDGELSLRELVDHYGAHAFDVLCVTDHALAPGDPYPDQCVTEERFHEYRDEIEREAERAWARYGLLLVPGLELTFNDVEPDRAAHAVVLGLDLPVPLEGGVGIRPGPARSTTARRGASVVNQPVTASSHRGSIARTCGSRSYRAPPSSTTCSRARARTPSRPRAWPSAASASFPALRSARRT